MNALDILKQQHFQAHAAFEDIETAPADGRGTVWADLQPGMTDEAGGRLAATGREIASDLRSERLRGPGNLDPSPADDGSGDPSASSSS